VPADAHYRQRDLLNLAYQDPGGIPLPYFTTADAEPLNRVLLVLSCGFEWGRGVTGDRPRASLSGYHGVASH
jgi:hypothetical protein